MGGLGHYLESDGIPTTQISLVREHTEVMRPPRALWVPFPLGRPLGAANDPALQLRVLRAALALLEAPEGPVLEDFPDEAAGGKDDGAEAPWACPIPLQREPEADDGPATVFRRELRGLQPWYDRACEQRGHTTVGASGLGISDLAEFLLAFLEDTAPTNPCTQLPLELALKAAAEDLKTLYFEAVTAQPGDASPTPAALDDWFWQETHAGQLLMEIKRHCVKSQDPALAMIANFMIVPVARSSWE
ncbi:MAG: hypothetical protein JRG84_02190 [Deltaproteobacteria bacterium]|nr:hypothetical protein [Deltaproteobacteria bacterium]